MTALWYTPRFTDRINTGAISYRLVTFRFTGLSIALVTSAPVTKRERKTDFVRSTVAPALNGASGNNNTRDKRSGDFRPFEIPESSELVARRSFNARNRINRPPAIRGRPRLTRGHDALFAFDWRTEYTRTWTGDGTF